MAKEVPGKSKEQGHKKLPKLPSNQKIQKRPLLHAPITAPRRGASSQKVVYISARSSFIAIVKRVRKFLSDVENRAAGPLSISGGDKKLLRGIEAGVRNKSNTRYEEVVMKATGKAIEKLLRLAIWWQEQNGIVVRIRTGSVGAVDDVVDKGTDGEGQELVEESRVRRTSCLEIPHTAEAEDKGHGQDPDFGTGEGGNQELTPYGRIRGPKNPPTLKGESKV